MKRSLIHIKKVIPQEINILHIIKKMKKTSLEYVLVFLPENTNEICERFQFNDTRKQGRNKSKVLDQEIVDLIKNLLENKSNSSTHHKNKLSNSKVMIKTRFTLNESFEKDEVDL